MILLPHAVVASSFDRERARIDFALHYLLLSRSESAGVYHVEVPGFLPPIRRDHAMTATRLLNTEVQGNG
jgi:hypothetical protein